MAKTIKYSEPAAYFPKEIRERFEKASKSKPKTTKSTKTTDKKKK